MTADVYGALFGGAKNFPKLEVMVAQPSVNILKATGLYEHVF